MPDRGAVRLYKILEGGEICIIGREEEAWIEDGDEELDFEQDLAEEVVTIEWWDPTNASDDSMWYEEENPVSDNNIWGGKEKQES